MKLSPCFVCLLLFGYHPKSNKKVTAAVKFAKIVTLRAKKLNIAINPQSHEAVRSLFCWFFPRQSQYRQWPIFFNALHFTIF